MAISVPTIEVTVRSIISLLDLKDDWDGDASIAPAQIAVLRALRWIVDLRSYLSDHNGQWLVPLVSDSADSGVMLEWWSPTSRRKLTVYVWEDRAEYVQVWGPDMLNEMAEGPAEPIDQFAPIWSWLTQ